MMVYKMIVVALALIIWNGAFGLHRPPPRYSQQYMPQTSFTCRNKIVGSYYADAETDCQLFHVCVSVAGSIQDYRFLCPNDTAFDQESQTCADWYDVDCEAATLYYASDNFDLYRIGSGLESLHYDSIRSDFEPQDHLQRSESNDPVRSSLNYNSNNYKESEIPKKNIVRANENNNQFASKNRKYAKLVNEKNLEDNQEAEKRINSRKLSRKPINNNSFTNNYITKSTTDLPSFTQTRYNEKSFGDSFTQSTMSPHPSIQTDINISKSKLVASTFRPVTKFISSATKFIDSEDADTNFSTTSKINFQMNDFNRFETTAKPTNNFNSHHSEPNNYSIQFTQTTTQATKQSSSEYRDHNYEQKTYNNYTNKNNNNYYYNNNHNSASLPTTSNIYDNYNSNSNNKYNSNNYAGNTYSPTTYSPYKNFATNKQYYNKSTVLTTHYTGSDSTKTSKKIIYHKSYQNFETSTKSYDVGRSSIELGFSPSSVNHLAENFRSTTPTPRRAVSPTTFNPNNFNVNTEALKNQATKKKSTYYPNQSVKQYSTAKLFDETTTRYKLTKKNDYDYAYYDNGPVEYDNIELEHVSRSKESVKIT